MKKKFTFSRIFASLWIIQGANLAAATGMAPGQAMEGGFHNLNLHPFSHSESFEIRSNDAETDSALPPSALGSINPDIFNPEIDRAFASGGISEEDEKNPPSSAIDGLLRYGPESSLSAGAKDDSNAKELAGINFGLVSGQEGVHHASNNLPSSKESYQRIPTLYDFAKAAAEYEQQNPSYGSRAHVVKHWDGSHYLSAIGNFSEKEFEGLVVESYRRPATLAGFRFGPVLGKGLAAVDGHIFFDGFFSLARHNYKYDQFSGPQLAGVQPYFHWDPVMRKYEIKKGAPAGILISKYLDDSGTLTFYRGIRNLRELFNWPITLITRKMSNSSKRVTKLAKILDGKDRDALFFSLDKDQAKRFSFLMASFKLKKEEFLRLVDQGHVYLGIEWGYVETAFSDLEKTSESAFGYKFLPTMIKPYLK